VIQQTARWLAVLPTGVVVPWCAVVRRGAPSPAKIVVDSGSAVDLVHHASIPK
jgi:hypothetical protein